MDEPQLTKQQFARVFDITPRQVDNWVADGIPRITVGKSRYRYGLDVLAPGAPIFPTRRWAAHRDKKAPLDCVTCRSEPRHAAAPLVAGSQRAASAGCRPDRRGFP